MKHHDNVKLHSCQYIDVYSPEHSKNEAACLAVLEEYSYVNILGYGSDGIVMDIGHKNALGLAIKLLDPHTKKRQTDNKIRKSCMVDNMLCKPEASPWMHLFSRTHGWTRCNSIPLTWQKGIDSYIANHAINSSDIPFKVQNGVYCMVSEMCGRLPVWKYKFEDEKECKCFLFEVVYGLSQAFYNFNFVHHDLNAGNVLLFNANIIEREYLFNEHTYFISSFYYPKIIDFGHSTFHAENYGHEIGGNINGLESFLAKVGGFALPLLEIIQNYDYSTFNSVLECSYFKELRNKRQRTQEIVESQIRCAICRKPATQKCKRTPSYKFCDNINCVAYMGPILNIVKEET